MRIDWADLEQRVCQSVFCHATLDDIDMQMDPSGHLDSTAEGDFTIPLREVVVAHGELGALHIDGEIDPRAARNILDVAVPAMLTRWNCPGGFLARLFEGRTFQASEQHAFGRRRQCKRRNPVGIARDQLRFPFVPSRQEFVARCGADKPGVGDGSEANPWNMARGRIDALAVPYRLARLGENVCEKAPAILRREDTGIAPFIPPKRPDIQNVHHQNVIRLSAGDFYRPDQMMTGR